MTKKKSKRVSLKDKYTIKKRVKEHHRKQRREARKRIKSGVQLNKPKKALGLPNLMPFKEKFLEKMIEDREREKAQEKRRLEYLRSKREEEAMDEGYDDSQALAPGSNSKKRKRSSGPSAEDLANAAQRAEEFERKQAEKMEQEKEEEESQGIKGKKRQYMRELRNVVESSDVVLLVLDARDPMGTRAPQAEKMVLENAKNKRLICILNKIDLVPKQVVDQWLTQLRKEFPTVAFRASTQEQKTNLGRASKDSIGLGASSSSSSSSSIGDSVCVGADTLLQLLKNYSRNRDIKTSITVGVVGYPNVGKSSVINSLKRTRAVGVSATAGYTKALQHVQLDKKVKLIDSPGVLFHDSSRKDRLILRNCVNVSDLQDAVGPVSKLIEQCNKEQLMILYTLPRFRTATEFLVLLAQKRGKLLKGGVPDQNAAARLVLQDWNSGKIPYYVLPPKQAKSERVQSRVVSEWSKEFDLEALLAKEDASLVEHVPSVDDDEFAVVFKDSIKL